MSGMGLINRKKRQHAWPARTMAPPTLRVRGYVPPAALWCAARHTSPRSLPWVPRLRTRLPLVPSSAHAYSGVNRVGGLTAARLCARRPGSLRLSLASSSHRTAGSQARRLPGRCVHLRAPRSPNRQVGGRLLRCYRSCSPGASADSLTRHATPAVSSFFGRPLGDAAG